jgi:hypothetical protein
VGYLRARLYLIHMIDDATSELTARFVQHDSTEENMRLLWTYLERHGRPLAFYTDKASLFQTAPKIGRDHKQWPREEPQPLPPTQIGRALAELGITWIAAHSPQAKGRIERSFATAQDRLVKGLRVAGVRTIDQANRYLEQEFLPWWNQHLVVLPANPIDAHRPLGAGHDLAAMLSHVETRQLANDYTLQFQGAKYRIVSTSIRPRMRGAAVRVEKRLDGSLALAFQGGYVDFQVCSPAVQLAAPAPTPRPRKPTRDSQTTAWGRAYGQMKDIPLWQAAKAPG